MQTLDSLLRSLVARGFAPAIQICLKRGGKTVFEGAYGLIDDTGAPTNLETRFDMASVSKLFASAAFMTLVDKGLVSPYAPARTVLPELTGERRINGIGRDLGLPGCGEDWAPGQTADVSGITFEQLLTHTSGIGPRWIYRYPTLEEKKAAVLRGTLCYPPGRCYLYSCMGLNCIGWAAERLSGLSLDELVRETITKPLGINAGYLPLSDDTLDRSNIAATEWCSWRKRRIQGQVHDENAYSMNGVAANAGIFCTARDLASFGQALLDAYNGRDGFLRTETVRDMAREHATKGLERRGLGFQLRSLDPEAHTRFLSEDTFGHTGYVGTCLWIDPRRDLTCALLTNEVYNGREGRRILPLRTAVFEWIGSLYPEQ